MTLHGDLYYEGKEFEIRLKEKKPGNLSDDLRTTLSAYKWNVLITQVCLLMPRCAVLNMASVAQVECES